MFPKRNSPEDSSEEFFVYGQLYAVIVRGDIKARADLDSIPMCFIFKTSTEPHSQII